MKKGPVMALLLTVPLEQVIMSYLFFEVVC